MGLVGWVATHTGLPAFYATGTGNLTADHPLLGEEMPRLVVKVSGEALVADAGAAAGVPTTYRFGSQSVTLTRKGVNTNPGLYASDWLTDVSGDVVAGANIVWGDPREYETGAHIFTSALGTQIPRYPLGQAPPTGTLEVVTTTAGTEILRGFAATLAPLWVIHNEAACSREDCDIEGSRLVVVHRMSEVMSQRRTRAQRNWILDYSRVPTSLAPSGLGAASGTRVVTWGQWRDWGKKNSPSGWQNWSALEVARLIAGMPEVV